MRQTYEGASVRTPIHRLLAIERHAVNAEDFAARRASALMSNDVMLRDTPEGFRYLTRARGERNAEGGDRTADGARVLAGPATRIRTFHAKLSEGAILHLDQQVNSWLDGHPDLEIKFASTTVGTWEGKHPEPNLILTIFY